MVVTRILVAKWSPQEARNGRANPVFPHNTHYPTGGAASLALVRGHSRWLDPGRSAPRKSSSNRRIGRVSLQCFVWLYLCIPSVAAFTISRGHIYQHVESPSTRSVWGVNTLVSRRFVASSRLQASDGWDSPPTDSPVLDTATTHSNATRSTTHRISLQELKDSVDIVTVMESFQLKGFVRKGTTGSAMALCPFHDDRTPSLHMDAKRQLYKCFACGAGGDVVRFVQEYSKLPLGQRQQSSHALDTTIEQPLSFGQAIHYVSTRFGPGAAVQGSYSGPNTNPALQRQKERILLANAAAASYFATSLRHPTAGGARYHVQQRGLSLRALRTFAMGYAPDVYFGKTNSSSPWGHGSLVHRLRDLNFTAREILDAGLATRTKASFTSSVTGGTKLKVNSTEDTVDYSGLMDRFRGRLMVPIFDKTGTRVLGFGGRLVTSPTLEPDDASGQSYKPPKYLNSPESLVFEKKRILFGQNLALQSHVSHATRAMPLVLVEGYMDAIALWDAGFSNVVATMGTAVATEQLDGAAKTAGMQQGRIVLCLDQDAAGQAAVERLCRNGMLADCVKRHAVSIGVAMIPYGVKDPAEFMELRRRCHGTTDNVARAAAEFQHVIETAVDWTDWYLQAIIGAYKSTAPSGTPGSFANVFDRMAEFFATLLHPADRMRRAHAAVELLCVILAREQNQTEVATAVQTRLEQDLVESISRRVDAASALQRRAAVNAHAHVDTLSALVRGYGPNSSDDESRLSKQTKSPPAGTANRTSSLLPRPRQERTGAAQVAVPKRPPVQQDVKAKRAILKRQTDAPVESLTPHFAGFKFHLDSDRDWLFGDQSSKRKNRNNVLVLGSSPLSAFGLPGDSGKRQSARRDELVYFNSADFNGHQFLTDDARNAGYSIEAVKPDASLIEHGISSMLQPDVARLGAAVEASLLRLLVRQSSVRVTIKNMLTARNAVITETGSDLLWSCPTREWLFGRLVIDSDQLPAGNSSGLREYLSSLRDTPAGAFAESEPATQNARNALAMPNSSALCLPEDLDFSAFEFGVNESAMILSGAGRPSTASRFHLVLGSKPGLLDIYFDDDNREDGSILNDTAISRSHLAAREHVATLMWVSAAAKVKSIRQELVASVASMSTRNTQQEKTDDVISGDVSTTAYAVGRSANLDIEVELNDGTTQTLSRTATAIQVNKETDPDTNPDSSLQLDSNQTELLARLYDATRTLQSLKESAKRLTLQLLDESSSSGLGEGHMSTALQADLASRLDDHVREVCQQSQNDDSVYRDRGKRDEPYEVALERMAEEWGDWFDDEYIWKPVSDVDAIGSGPDDSALDESDIERETLDEFFTRVNREWKGWDDV